MPYDIHITKAQSWLNSKQDPITDEEVKQLIIFDGELSFSKIDSIEMTNENREVVNHYAINWNGSPKFLYLDGEIKCSDPDEKTIIKMIRIAKRLGAIVQGDDEEIYKLTKVFGFIEKLNVKMP